MGKGKRPNTTTHDKRSSQASSKLLHVSGQETMGRTNVPTELLRLAPCDSDKNSDSKSATTSPLLALKASSNPEMMYMHEATTDP